MLVESLLQAGYHVATGLHSCCIGYVTVSLLDHRGRFEQKQRVALVSAVARRIITSTCHRVLLLSLSAGRGLRVESWSMLCLGGGVALGYLWSWTSVARPFVTLMFFWREAGVRGCKRHRLIVDCFTIFLHECFFFNFFNNRSSV